MVVDDVIRGGSRTILLGRQTSRESGGYSIPHSLCALNCVFTLSEDLNSVL